jgi:curved DNA-binding protein CbpA
MTKDYYRILGVLDDAEDVVIRAAYKALAQRYHPDKWTGNKDEANRRMQEINEAYAVLSDAVKRRQYDATRDKSEYQENENDFEDELVDSLENDWKDVVGYFPDLEMIAKGLAKTSKSLEYTYKVLLLEHKKFNERNELAKILENHFLETYFGKNPKIIAFAKQLILLGDKKSAKELNRAVNLLGSDVDPTLIINRIIAKNSKTATPNSSSNGYQRPYDKDARKNAFNVINQPCLPYAKIFFESIGGQVRLMSDDWDYYQVSFGGEEKKITTDSVVNWAVSIAKTIV